MRAGLLGLLALAAALASWRLGEPSLNVDEAFSLLLARQDLGRLLTWLSYDNHPPLFYLLLKVWTLGGNSEAWLRTLPVLAHLGCVALVVWWAWTDEGRDAALYAGALAACSSWAILRAQEARQYSLLALLAWLSILALWRGRYGLYAVAATLAAYTHYNALMLLPAPWLWRPVRRRALAWAQLGVALAWLPWLPVLLGQFSAREGTSVLLAGSVYAQPYPSYVADLLVFLGPGAHTRLVPWAEAAVTLAFGALVVRGFLRMRQRPLAELLALCLLAVLVESTLAWYGLGRVLFTAKHAHFLYVGLYLLAGVGLASLRVPLRVAAASLLIACNLASWTTATWDPVVQNPPWRRIVSDVEARRQPGDAVVVFVLYQSLAYRHYAPGDTPIYAFAPGGDLEGFAEKHRRVFLVLAHVGTEDPEGRVQAAFDARFRLAEEIVYPNEAPFDQVRTRLYETR